MRMSFCKAGPSFTRSRSKARRRANIETRTKQDAFAPGLKARDSTKPSTLLSRGDGRQQIVAPLPCLRSKLTSTRSTRSPNVRASAEIWFAPSQPSSMTFPSMVSSQKCSSPTFSVFARFFGEGWVDVLEPTRWEHHTRSTPRALAAAEKPGVPRCARRTAARLSRSSMRWSSASRRCKVARWWG